MGVSDIKRIVEVAGAQEVALSGWDAEPFVCRLRKPTVFGMAISGVVPNPLMPVVDRMFRLDKNLNDALKKIPMADSVKVMVGIAKVALVEPTYKQLEDAGVSLTDTQIMEIYSYVLGGAAGLERFHGELRGRPGGNGDQAERSAEQPAALG